jgi:hypothetical protein
MIFRRKNGKKMYIMELKKHKMGFPGGHLKEWSKEHGRKTVHVLLEIFIIYDFFCNSFFFKNFFAKKCKFKSLKPGFNLSLKMINLVITDKFQITLLYSLFMPNTHQIKPKSNLIHSCSIFFITFPSRTTI